MNPSCICRTNTLRTFMRNVAQIYVSNEPLTRAPWTSPHAISNLSRRQMHTDTDQSPQEYDPQSTSEEAYGSKGARQKKPRWRDTREGWVPRRDRPAQDKATSKASPKYRERGNRPPSTDRPPRTNANGIKGDRMSRMVELQRYKMAAIHQREKAEDPTHDKLDDKEKELRRKEKMPMWALQKEALVEKFPEGWNPRKRLSPDAIEGIKALHKQFPEVYTTPVLAQRFQVSAEAIRRILKSNWEPTVEEEEDRQERWFRRGTAVWSRWAELGLKPPKKWREEGIEKRPVRYYRPAPEEQAPWTAEDVDPQTARRLKVQNRIAQNLV